MRPIGLLLAVFLLALPARADDAADAREHFKKGQTHYSLGEFQDAVQEFREAYRIRHEPAILFNIGQAMRQIRQFQQAYFYYQQYLAQRADAPNRVEVEQLMAQMKKKIDADAEEGRQRGERDNATPGPARSPEDHLEDSDPSRPAPAQKVAAAATPRAGNGGALPASPGASTSAPSAATAAAPPPAPAKPGSSTRLVGYVAAGTGLLVEGAAFALHGSAQSAADELNRKYSGGQLGAADAHLRSDAQSKGKLATAALLGGAVLIVAGAVLAFAF